VRLLLAVRVVRRATEDQGEEVVSLSDEVGEPADGSGWWRYYVWLGAVRFEIKRPLTRWERVRCWFSPWVYEEVFLIPGSTSGSADE
jgi:hypothetical protein